MKNKTEQLREKIDELLIDLRNRAIVLHKIDVRPHRDIILKACKEKGMVWKIDRELPKELTNNIGCMSKVQIENFAAMVLQQCGYLYTMKWTAAGDIMIEPFIYIDERHIDEYPYIVKERVLHEIAHIDTHPQDDRHGEIFHRKYAELVNRFLAGYTAYEEIDIEN